MGLMTGEIAAAAGCAAAAEKLVEFSIAAGCSVMAGKVVEFSAAAGGWVVLGGVVMCMIGGRRSSREALLEVVVGGKTVEA